MDTNKSLATPNCPRRNRACGQDCVLISSRPDFRTCTHLNPVVVLTDIGKSLRERSQNSKASHENDVKDILKTQDKFIKKKCQTVQTKSEDKPHYSDKKPKVESKTLDESGQLVTEETSKLDRESNTDNIPSKTNRKRKLSWDPNVEYEVERIVGYRRYKKYKMLYLVQWKNYENCTTLEPIENLTGCIYELMKCLEKNTKPSELEIYRKESELKQMLQNSALFQQLIKGCWKLSDLQLFKTLDVREIFNTKDLDELEKNTRKQYKYIIRCLIVMSKYPDSGLVQRGLDYQLYLTLISRRKFQLKQLSEKEKAINNLETVPVVLENSVDFDFFPNIKYVTDMVLGKNVELPGAVLGCECKRGCTNKSNCCGILAGSNFAYDTHGRLRFEEKIPIYECNSKCKCDNTCTNRVVQKGRRFKLSIFKTVNCGWGVKALEDIPKGSFVCEYFGELIPESEAKVRETGYSQRGSSYIFDLDFDEGSGEMFCVDATHCGNVSRFINHSCEPNLMVFPVWVDCLEVNLYRLGFFAIKDILKGDEVTFDYISADNIDRENEDEEEKENIRPRNKAGLRCLCGKAKCRKWLFF